MHVCRNIVLHCHVYDSTKLKGMHTSIGGPSVEHAFCVLQADLLPVCRELGIGVLAYSPLGRGLLTGASCQAVDSTLMVRHMHQGTMWG